MTMLLLTLLIANPAPSLTPQLRFQLSESAQVTPDDPPESPETTSPAPSPPSEQARPEKVRTGTQWMLHIAPGANFVFSRYYRAYGPTLRFGGLATRWIGNMMIGGGPVLTYGFLLDPSPAKDRIHFFTLQGDFMIGGGRHEKFAIFAHLSLGGGIASAKDGTTNLRLTVPWIRAAAGVGAYGHITPRFSLGAIVDFGYLGGLGVDTVLTANIHFGPRSKR